MNLTTLTIAAAVVAAGASVASATTRSSFLDVPVINGISVVPLAPLSFRVTLQPGASFSLGGTTYPIQNLIGFYALSNATDFTPLVSLPTIGNFRDDSTNSGPGGVQGWKSNPNQGLNIGDTLDFTFPSLDAAKFEQVGYHVRLSDTLFPGTSGNTGNITLVPTSGTTAAALVALAGTRRRRRS